MSTNAPDPRDGFTPDDVDPISPAVELKAVLQYLFDNRRRPKNAGDAVLAMTHHIDQLRAQGWAEGKLHPFIAEALRAFGYKASAGYVRNARKKVSTLTVDFYSRCAAGSVMTEGERVLKEMQRTLRGGADAPKAFGMWSKPKAAPVSHPASEAAPEAGLAVRTAPAPAPAPVVRAAPTARPAAKGKAFRKADVAITICPVVIGPEAKLSSKEMGLALDRAGFLAREVARMAAPEVLMSMAHDVRLALNLDARQPCEERGILVADYLTGEGERRTQWSGTRDQAECIKVSAFAEMAAFKNAHGFPASVLAD
ncbi:hypothetical protein [Falsiroseomonas sp.]|uniref:hypothetical protein n=1 Tax=Falsiroseomonas sp. TaxID=2870721 RepID=UPI003F718D04